MNPLSRTRHCFITQVRNNISMNLFTIKADIYLKLRRNNRSTDVTTRVGWMLVCCAIFLLGYNVRLCLHWNWLVHRRWATLKRKWITYDSDWDGGGGAKWTLELMLLLSVVVPNLFLLHESVLWEVFFNTQCSSFVFCQSLHRDDWGNLSFFIQCNLVQSVTTHETGNEAENHSVCLCCHTVYQS